MTYTYKCSYTAIQAWLGYHPNKLQSKFLSKGHRSDNYPTGRDIFPLPGAYHKDHWMPKRALLAHHQLFQGSSTTSHKSDTYEPNSEDTMNMHITVSWCFCLFGDVNTTFNLYNWRSGEICIMSKGCPTLHPDLYQNLLENWLFLSCLYHQCLQTLQKFLEYWKHGVSINFWGQIHCSKPTGFTSCFPEWPRAP